MFRSLPGFQADYHELKVLVVSEFNEWRVLVYGPGVSLHGAPQFGEEKAKLYGLNLAKKYLIEEKKQEVPEAEDVSWQPAGREAWLVWRG